MVGKDGRVHDFGSSGTPASLSQVDSMSLQPYSGGDENKRGLPNTSIHQAARNGLTGILRDLIDANVNVNDLDENGVSPLHYAARFNHYEAVEMLVKIGNADCHIKDEEGAIPLHYACRKRQRTLENEDGYSGELDVCAKDNQVMHILPCKTNMQYLLTLQDNMNIIRFLSRQCEINLKDNWGCSPLHIAAMRGNMVAIRTLLDCHDIMINAMDDMGCTALHEAATFNQIHVASALIERGASMLTSDKDRCTALHQAALEGFVDVAKLMIEKSEEMRADTTQFIKKHDRDGCNAFHYAIEAKSLPLVKLLYEHGADVNERCRVKSLNSTPLHLAASSADRAIAEFLIRKKARLESRDSEGSTPLHKAAEAKNEEVIKVLLANITTTVDPKDRENYTPLLVAVCYDNEVIVQSLLDEHASLIVTQKDEKNILHLAVENEQLKVLKTLLKEASEKGKLQDLINDDDRFGNTPLHIAAENGNLTMTKLLLNRGAKISCKNEEEETPVLLASKNGHRKVVLEFIKQSTTVINDEDEFSNTALHLAAGAGHLSVVEALCDSYADKNAKNTRGYTPIDLASASGHEPVVKYFLNEDVLPSPPDADRKQTPLHLACKNGHDNVVSLLLSRGADCSIHDGDGDTPLFVAIESGKHKAVSTILKSDHWHKALCSERRYANGRPRDTPLRELLTHMPDMANLALGRCVSTGPDNVSLHDTNHHIDFNYEFLDDTYTPYKPNDRAKLKHELKEHGDVSPPDDMRCYTDDLGWAKKNHPLTILAEEKRDVLTNHPLVLALIRHKWSTCKTFYYLFLLFYAFFVGMYTAYMVVADPPYTLSENITDTCEDEGVEWLADSFQDVAKVILFILAIIGMILEIFQLIGTRWLYFDYVNIVDWFTYISVILVVVDLTNCGAREDWQWQLGAVGMLFSWLDLLLFFRRLPALGIYVVMITEIFFTFAKFFLIFFLFILAFAFTFHVLLQNQDPFEDSGEAIVKTWVMMLGEFDFNDIFHPEEFSQGEEDVAYRETTYFIFVIFLIVMAIIVLNLLVGLAVDDVSALRFHSKVVKLQMQIDLALDIEFALPNSWRRSLNYNVWKQRYLPNAELTNGGRVARKLSVLTDGPMLSQKAIVKASRAMEPEDEGDLAEVENRLTEKIDKANKNLKVLYVKMDRTEDMLTKILNKLDPPTRPPRGRRNLPRHETAPELPRVVRQLVVDGVQDAPQEEDEDESNI